MKLIIEKITATRNNKAGFKQVWLRRDSSYDNSTSAGLDNFFLGGQPKPGRLGFQTMSDAIIEKIGVEVGADLNELLENAGAPKVAVMVFETTEPEAQDENIRLSLTKPKINPTSGEILKRNGKEIFGVTLVIPLDKFTGDVLVQHDKEIE